LTEDASPPPEPASPASREGPEDSTSEGPEFPSLEPAFQLMLFAYNEYEASLGSLNTRAGVALGLAAAALIVVLPRGPEAATWILNPASLIAFLAVLFFVVAVGLLAWSLLSKTTRAGYSTNELRSKEWRKSLTDFYLQQLSNLREAINARQRLLDKKADLFNSGVASALLGLLLLFVSRALWLFALWRL